MNLNEFLFIVAIVAGTVVICLSFFVIKKAAKSPINGEIQKLKHLDIVIEKHRKIINRHVKVAGKLHVHGTK